MNDLAEIRASLTNHGHSLTFVRYTAVLWRVTGVKHPQDSEGPCGPWTAGLRRAIGGVGLTRYCSVVRVEIRRLACREREAPCPGRLPAPLGNRSDHRRRRRAQRGRAAEFL